MVLSASIEFQVIRPPRRWVPRPAFPIPGPHFRTFLPQRPYVLHDIFLASGVPFLTYWLVELCPLFFLFLNFMVSFLFFCFLSLFWSRRKTLSYLNCPIIWISLLFWANANRLTFYPGGACLRSGWSRPNGFGHATSRANGFLWIYLFTYHEYVIYGIPVVGLLIKEKRLVRYGSQQRPEPPFWRRPQRLVA